jgi:hypothetical protein
MSCSIAEERDGVGAVPHETGNGACIAVAAGMLNKRTALRKDTLYYLSAKVARKLARHRLLALAATAVFGLAGCEWMIPI